MGRPLKHAEETEVFSVRLPRSAVSWIDENRGDLSRADWVLERTQEPRAAISVPRTARPKGVAPWRPTDPVDGCEHPKGKRKDLGYMSVCTGCGARIA